MQPWARRSGKSQIFSGIGFTIFFGFLTIWLHNPFIAIPLFFTGILPIMKGIDRQIGNRPKSRIENRQKPKTLSPDEQERMVLKCAREKRGIVTPAIVAVEDRNTHYGSRKNS